MEHRPTEIKIQGYGGQGVVMAVEILATTMSRAGYQVQSFSQYGAERRGGKVESYLRISKGQIFTHSGIYEADYLVLASKALATDAHLAGQVRDGGTLFVNAPQAPEGLSLSGKQVTIVALDADRIAIEHGVRLPSGMPVINTTLVGGLLALFPDVPFDLVKEVLKEKKIPAVEKNIAAAEEAFRYVTGHAENLPAAKVEGTEEVVEKKESPVFRPGISPCEVECPAGVPVRDIITWVQQGKIRHALTALRAENPLPGICGRACFHPCETACNRNQFDEGVAINALERAVSDLVTTPAKVKQSGRTASAKKVAVIGSGPAGMSCAYFLRMMGHRVTVFEALPVAGGVPRTGIPAYRLPRDVVDQQIKNVIDTGVELRTGVQVEGPLFEQIMATYDACFVATGAHLAARLNIPGEESRDVMSGLQFLKRIALGEQATVTERVAVIGGGNTAVDAARTAKRLGAKEVILIYRRSEEEMPAYKDEVAHAKEEGVSIIYLSAPVRIHSSAGRVNRLECVKMALLDKGSDGRREVRPIEGSTFMLDAESVIAAVGEAIHIPFLPESVRHDGSLIKVDMLGRTSLRGLYAGGDVATSSRSIAHAIGSGKRAAIGIDLFLNGKEDGLGKEHRSIVAYLSQIETTDALKTLSLADLNPHYFKRAPRSHAKVLPPETRANHFNEVNRGLSKKAAIKEADRCFRCGVCVSCGNCYIFCPDIAVAFDESPVLPTLSQDVCKACGICIDECPHGVIQWERS